ncbi:MAG: chemotaxis protein CheW [Chloroflexota bacterium]|nr:chemotaxis protein CheW [Chloroflexota bacterium]
MASEDLNILQRAVLAQRAGNYSSALSASLLQAAQLGQLRADDVASTARLGAAGEQYLAFSLLERDFALKAEYIQSVERLVDVTPVPNVAPWVSGVINLRGSIASVIDLRAFLDMEPLAYNPRTRLLTVQCNEMVICLVVDSVSEMLPIPATTITGASTRQTVIPQWAAPYAAGAALLGKRVLVLLDAARLLFSDKMQHYEVLE